MIRVDELFYFILMKVLVARVAPFACVTWRLSGESGTFIPYMKKLQHGFLGSNMVQANTIPTEAPNTLFEKA